MDKEYYKRVDSTLTANVLLLVISMQLHNTKFMKTWLFTNYLYGLLFITYWIEIYNIPYEYGIAFYRR